MGKFVLLEEADGWNYTMMSGYFGYLNRKFLEKFGLNVDAAMIYSEGTGEIWVCKEDWAKVGKKILEKLVSSERFRNECTKETLEYIQKINAFASSLPIDPPRLADAQLSLFFRQYGPLFLEAHVTGQMEQVSDMISNYFTYYLMNYLGEKAAEKNIGVGEAFATLTTPIEPTLAWKEELELARVETDAQLAAHAKKWEWLWFNYEGPAPSLVFFEERRKKIKNPRRFIAQKRAEKARLEKRQRELEKELGFDEKHLKVFAHARSLPWLKAERKDAMYFLCYKMTPLFKEAARRLGVSLDEFRAHAPLELGDSLSGKVPKEALGERRKFSVVACIGGNEKSLVGAEARRFVAENRLFVEKLSADEVKGTCACPGFAKGIARLVNSVADLPKVKEGDILISSQTNPNFLPAMERAAAFVTDVGGLTCHASIVAREMKKPCVVGAKVATKVFRDGDLVEVDAAKGIVRKL